MPQDPKQQPQTPSDAPPPPKPQPEPLSDEALDQVSGGAKRRGGDDDLEDLEVER
jgi:hypothetical protein